MVSRSDFGWLQAASENTARKYTAYVTVRNLRLGSTYRIAIRDGWVMSDTRKILYFSSPIGNNVPL